MSKSGASTERAKVYRLAAANLERIEEPGVAYRSPYSCDQIGHACGWFPHIANRSAGRKFNALKARYKALFSPNADDDDYWDGWDDAQNERILALCFMAAMVEAGDA